MFLAAYYLIMSLYYNDLVISFFQREDKKIVFPLVGWLKYFIIDSVEKFFSVSLLIIGIDM